MYVRSFYPALNAHAPHCNLRPARLYSIHHHHLINSKNSEKKAIEHEKRVYVFRIAVVWNIFRFRNNWARYDKKIYIGLHVRYSLFLWDINETWIFSIDFSEILEFHENPSSGSRVVPCGRTDMTKLVVAAHYFAKAPRNIPKYCSGFKTPA